MFCLEDRNVRWTHPFHTVTSTGLVTLQRRERKGGAEADTQASEPVGGLCSGGCLGDSETGQIPGSPDSDPETASPMPRPSRSSARCLGHRPALKQAGHPLGLKPDLAPQGNVST